MIIILCLRTNNDSLALWCGQSNVLNNILNIFKSYIFNHQQVKKICFVKTSINNATGYWLGYQRYDTSRYFILPLPHRNIAIFKYLTESVTCESIIKSDCSLMLSFYPPPPHCPSFLALGWTTHWFPEKSQKNEEKIFQFPPPTWLVRPLVSGNAKTPQRSARREKEAKT